MRIFLRRCLGLGILAFALASCIVVDDFGGYWEKGFIDNCVNDIVMSSHDYARPRSASTKPLLMRSLRVGKHTLLMIREDMKSKGGNLMRYKIENGEYVSYRLNESKREDFLRDYPDSMVVLTTETASIPVLNPESLMLISNVADDESYWVESHRENYNPSHRTDCIQTLY